MARLRRAIHGVASSYLLLATTAGYALVSVPLALHYLDKDRFGLWALMTSLIGYLSLVDGGMTGSAARLIIDHKDNRDGGYYGGFLKTVFVVTALQGLIVFTVGLTFASGFGELLAIKHELWSEFTNLLKLQCGIAGFGFSMRIFGLVLTGHQRMDLVNYSGMLSLGVNLSFQWVFFYLGFGVFSLSWATFCALGVSVLFQGIACGILRFFPKWGSWGALSWTHFKEIFNFAKDLFLVAIGTQLIMASQTIIITRILGLPTAAVWSVGLRIFNLLNQVIWRVSDMSGSALAEMLARGEIIRLRERYRSLAVLTFSLAGWMAFSFAGCNSLFVSIWTHGKIYWPPTNDWLLAGWMILSAVVHCHNCFVLLTKKIGSMRYIYFLEGIVFVFSSLLIARWGGLTAIIFCSIICGTAFSCTYGIWRISRFFEISFSEVAFGWLQPMFKMLLFYLPAVGLAWWLLSSVTSMTRLTINVLLAVSLGAYLFLRFGIPGSLQHELLRRVPARAVPILKRVFLQPTC